MQPFIFSSIRERVAVPRTASLAGGAAVTNSSVSTFTSLTFRTPVGQWHEVKGGSGAPAEGGVSRRNDEEKKTNRSFTG
jgi:hypothetical protein